MCTVTIISLRQRGSYRLAANRDESRARPLAIPPERRTFGSRQGVMPIDPPSGGTWIGMNDAGLAMTLLNIYPDVAGSPARSVPPGTGSAAGPGSNAGAGARAGTGDSPAPRSRGTIIPALLHCESVDVASRLVSALDPAEYSAFRLVMVDGNEIAEVESDGARIRMKRARWEGEPRLFTSSGLGDHVVDRPRRALFQEFFGLETHGLETVDPRDGEEDLRQRQDAYHRHSWPDKLDLSVCMSRDVACTVSLTVIETGPRGATLVYYPAAPDLAPCPFEVGLPLAL